MPKRDYAVGRGKPPVECQFKKGQSGNPGGKLGAGRSFRERLRTAVEAALEQDVWTLRQAPADKPLQKIANELVVKAAGGNQQALRVFLTVTEKLDEAAPATAVERALPVEPTSTGSCEGAETQKVTLSEGNFQGNALIEPPTAAKDEAEQ
jgi:hypothetical protein